MESKLIRLTNGPKDPDNSKEEKNVQEVQTSEVFDFHLGDIRDTVYIVARRYTEPNYSIRHNFWNPEHRNANSIDGNLEVREDKRFNDCFGSVWIVLNDLAKMGFIRRVYSKSIIDTIPIIQNSIRVGFMSEFDNLEILEGKLGGIFFALRRGEIGWEKFGMRHLGFWFYFNNEFRIIHNTRGVGVVEVIMSPQEFENYIKSFYKVYL